MEIKKIETSGEQVKFNMGLATLENIRNLLNFYHKVSVMDVAQIDDKSFKITDTLEAQIIKSRTCNQLLLASRPLLNSEQKKKLEEELKKTALCYKYYKDQNGNVVCKEKIFSSLVDDNCDNFIALLEDLLQENKVFMPGKGEGSLF